MGLFTKDIKTMEDMFLHGLQDIYYAENQITKALPQMIEQATNQDLAAGLKSHLEETVKQVGRLEQVFKKLGKEPSATDCPAIDGIIKEAKETAGEIDNKAVLDAAIVANSQSGRALRDCSLRHAYRLGRGTGSRRRSCGCATTNLNEEKAANTKLNTIALRRGRQSRRRWPEDTTVRRSRR